MKVIALFSLLLLSACGVQPESNDKTNPIEQNIALLTSATWCEQDLNRNNSIETYRFYKDGRLTKANWNLNKQELSNFIPMTWTAVGNTLTISGETAMPKSTVYTLVFISFNGRPAISWQDKTKATPAILEQCSLPRDPR